ncbi:hypothetical protein BDY21DRAFT_66047 [Lineolata rhizophorae]|uniref:Uncharacterized protein n=1 Tax=Lineolata rhizophorae TaxID=578093 RepID=A0A6A6NW11_9PEZI|nr:hypothetical protein BDY21DRAFT_66047 [Lineolata rhizophorae]
MPEREKYRTRSPQPLRAAVSPSSLPPFFYSFLQLTKSLPPPFAIFFLSSLPTVESPPCPDKLCKSTVRTCLSSSKTIFAPDVPADDATYQRIPQTPQLRLRARHILTTSCLAPVAFPSLQAGSLTTWHAPSCLALTSPAEDLVTAFHPAQLSCVARICCDSCPSPRSECRPSSVALVACATRRAEGEGRANAGRKARAAAVDCVEPREHRRRLLPPFPVAPPPKRRKPGPHSVPWRIGLLTDPTRISQAQITPATNASEFTLRLHSKSFHSQVSSSAGPDTSPGYRNLPGRASPTAVTISAQKAFFIPLSARPP